ncbi:MAG: hypothetical protein ABIQ24_04730 [Nitrospiraceae bacterium]
MKNKRLLWMLAGGAVAFLLIVAYWMFALALADLIQPALAPPDKAATTQPAMWRAAPS